MPGLNLYLLSIILLVFSVVYRRIKFWRTSRSFPLPPGPKGFPIIGNVLDIPQDVPLWEVSLKLGRQYSQSTRLGAPRWAEFHSFAQILTSCT